MSRASTEKTETPKRAVRRRVTKTATSDTVAPPKRVSTRPAVTETPRRKAPSTLPATTSARTSYNKFYIAAALTLMAVGGSVFIGQSDAGVIDVASRVNESNQQAANAAASTEGNGAVAVPVQNTPPVVPISLLRGQGLDSGAQAPALPVVETEVTGEIGGEEASTTTEAIAESESESEIESEPEVVPSETETP